MLADPIVEFLARHGINAQALVLAIAAVIVVLTLSYLVWATAKGIVRW